MLGKKIIFVVMVMGSGISLYAIRDDEHKASTVKGKRGKETGGRRKRHSQVRWLKSQNLINLQNLQTIAMHPKLFVNNTDGPVLLQWVISGVGTSPLVSYQGSRTIPKNGKYVLSFVEALNYLNNDAQAQLIGGYDVTVSVARRKGYASTGGGLVVNNIDQAKLLSVNQFDLFIPTNLPS